MVSCEFVHVPASKDCISPLEVCSNFPLFLSVRNIPENGVSDHPYKTILESLHSLVVLFKILASLGTVQDSNRINKFINLSFNFFVILKSTVTFRKQANGHFL